MGEKHSQPTLKPLEENFECQLNLKRYDIKAMGFCLILFYKRSVVIMYLDDIVFCHRVSHLLPARLSAMPGSWSGHSMKLQKVFLKLRPQEDINSICRIAVHFNQVNYTKKSALKASLMQGERELDFFLLWSLSVLT